MNSTDAMRAVVAHAGFTSRAASAAVGRSPSWLSATLAQCCDTKASTLAQVGAACGYTLALVPSGAVPPGAITIDPAPPRA